MKHLEFEPVKSICLHEWRHIGNEGLKRVPVYQCVNCLKLRADFK